MSDYQLENGSELMGGMGGTGAQALVDSNAQRDALKDWDVQQVRFNGFVVNGQVMGLGLRVYDRIVKYVEVAVEGATPTGTLSVQLLVGTTLLTGQTYSLPATVNTNNALIVAGSYYGYFTVNGNGNGGAGTLQPVSGDPVSGWGVVVPGGYGSGAVNMANATILAAKITSAGGASDVVVTIHSRRRIL